MEAKGSVVFGFMKTQSELSWRLHLNTHWLTCELGIGSLKCILVKVRPRGAHWRRVLIFRIFTHSSASRSLPTSQVVINSLQVQMTIVSLFQLARCAMCSIPLQTTRALSVPSCKSSRTLRVGIEGQRQWCAWLESKKMEVLVPMAK